MPIKLALPKGRLLSSTSALLQNAGLEIRGYDKQSRSYRPQCSNVASVFLKVFNEKDIPIQVAIGNYDLGICGREWVEELLAKYPSSAVFKVLDLRYGGGTVYAACSRSAGLNSLEELEGKLGTMRIASEFPNLAESFALGRRLRRFEVFPLWGNAEAYPPENADLAVVSVPLGNSLSHELSAVTTILSSSAFLIAHKESWQSKDLSPVLQRLCDAASVQEITSEPAEGRTRHATASSPGHRARPDDIRVGLPDGHQQEPTLAVLRKAGITVEGNPEDPYRPSTNIPGITVQMVRPQDMPAQVACGNFDLAITGQDWLHDHLYRFPSSPVKEILNGALRIASEYTSIADKYARDNHLSPYRLVPAWGASEAFLPEDADMLIENVQTGRTLAQHDLKVIDTILESSACLIGSTIPVSDGSKLERINQIIRTLQQVIE
ncbi:MAG: ATP phosphoribosyltransferase [Chloroflexi bacterium]|nr:ATP phosphoribosyltransferase [Chloroflexota bacterium]